MMKRLDDKINLEKSAQAKRRVLSTSASSRLKPVSGTFPAWLFKD